MIDFKVTCKNTFYILNIYLDRKLNKIKLTVWWNGNKENEYQQRQGVGRYIQNKISFDLLIDWLISFNAATVSRYPNAKSISI